MEADFDKYNSEFVLSADAKKALERVGDKKTQDKLKIRMRPFTRRKYEGFKF